MCDSCPPEKKCGHFFNLNALYKNLKKCRHNYCGIIDAEGYRTGLGCIEWKGPKNYQRYTGNFLYNNIHNYGMYLIDKNDDRVYYEGMFYCNKLEGYGHVVYADGSNYEGSFSKHNRFGPGVRTNADGTQDVGLWHGFALERLAIEVNPDVIPKFGKTQQGSAKLLMFKKLVPLKCRVDDKAKEVLTHMGANEEILANSDVLYNKAVRYARSLFFNKKIFDETYYGEQDCIIDVIITKSEFEKQSKNTSDPTFHPVHVNEKTEVTQSTKHCPKSHPKTCACLEEARSKFDQVCAQLSTIESKLKTVEERKLKILRKLRHCKACCCQNIEAYLKANSDEAGQEGEDGEEEERTAREGSFEYFNKSCTPRSSDPMFSSYYNMPNSISSYMETLGVIKKLKQKAIVEKPSINSSQYYHTQTMQSIYKELKLTDSDPSVLPENRECICQKDNIESIEILIKQLNEVVKEEIFYEAVRNLLKNIFEVEFRKSERLAKTNPVYIKKVQIKQLLPWNNSVGATEILKHLFKHRKFEDSLSFRVAWIIGGLRDHFSPPGAYEKHCILFLELCALGHDRKAFTLLRLCKMNPDVADSKGNSGIFFAVMNNWIPVITMLVKCGANVSTTNDEGLTPLSLAFLQYLSMMYRVTDWEKAYLKEPRLSKEDLLEVGELQPPQSLTSSGVVTSEKTQSETSLSYRIDLESIGPMFSTSNMKLSTNEELYKSVEMSQSKMCIEKLFDFEKEQEYIFDVDYKRIIMKRNKKAKKLPKQEPEKDPENDESCQKKNSASDDVEEEAYITVKLAQIKKIIISLCSYYADPNIGELPMPLLCLSIFTEDADLVRVLLENEANPNVTWDDDFNLTSLHIVASLKPSEENGAICKTLLRYKANPNIRTNGEHWSQFIYEILGNDTFDGPKEGKNPLHILCMREDFVEDPSNFMGDMARILIDHNCSTSDQYLGHTPLSLAILRGNLRLIEDLFRSQKVDPHQDHGKNPLHILCMREDFVEDPSNFMGDMARILIDHNCSTSDQYLGHTPLSLAILRGNLRLIEDLFRSQKVDPHQELGNNMGNAFTVLLLKRYSHTFSPETTKAIIDLLITLGANPLCPFGTFENTIHFLEVEAMNAQPTGKKKKKTRINLPKKPKSSKKTARKSATSKKSTRNKKKGKKATKKEPTPTEYLIIQARRVLYRQLQSKAVGYLYIFICQQLYNDTLIRNLTRFVDPDEALRCIQLIFQYRRLDPQTLNLEKAAQVVEFTKCVNNPQYKPNIKNSLHKICDLSFTEIVEPTGKYYMPLPELDKDWWKYRVCFECLRHKQPLIKCPQCEMIYFCSHECNVANAKTCSLHRCDQLIFYEDAKRKLSEPQSDMKRSRLADLLDLAQLDRGYKQALAKWEAMQDKLSRLKYKSKALLEKAQILEENLNNFREAREEFPKSHQLLDYKTVQLFSSSSYKRLTRELSPFWKGRIIDDLERKKFTTANNSRRSMLKFGEKFGNIVDESTKKSVTFDQMKLNILSLKEDLAIEKKLGLKSSTPFRDTSPVELRKISGEVITNKRISYTDDCHSVEETHEKLINKKNVTKLLSKVFVDFNLPLTLLPYSCYKDGQIYYTMSDNPYFNKIFNKLPIADL